VAAALEAVARPLGALLGSLAGILFCLWLLGTRSYAQIWLLLLILAAGLLLRAWVARSGARLAGGDGEALLR
jgi:hypothetical protein